MPVRLFTAIDVPDAWRTEATRVQRALAAEFQAELRWVAAEQLHVTVRFLGEVADEVAANLVRAIEAIEPLRLDLQLEPAGSFGAAARTNVVWLGIGIGDAAATTLLGAVDRAIEEAGLPSSEAGWRPHLTLARVRRQASADRRRELARAVRDLPAPGADSHLMRSISLYRSDLGNRAPHHKLLARSAVG